jgi:adenylate cyclase
MAREIDSVLVAGKEDPVTIYEIIGYPEEVDGRMQEAANHYAEGLEAYRNQDWNSAQKFFNKALEATPDDGPSKTMLNRCNEYKVNPPDRDWNGVFPMLTK